MRIVNYVPGIQGVADSSVATLNLPVNRRYHSLHIQTLANGVAADATLNASLVELIVNGIVPKPWRRKRSNPWEKLPVLHSLSRCLCAS